VLILGGTTEASALARELAGRTGLQVTTSFAGLTDNPRAAAGETRVGGFGGPEGLARHLRDEGVDVLLDATHPFAARMRWNAVDAAAETGVARLRVERPAWRAQPGDCWISVGDLEGAADAVQAHRRAFLTTGRKELAPFAVCRQTWFLVRAIEPPDPMPLADAEVLLDRGPFTVEGERALLVDRAIDVVVAKNSGADATEAKLVAARDLQLPVVMVERPPNPPGPRVETVADALLWFDDVLAALDAR
jgi:precorrin-6A/cobalt-precorrin-6A reductase